MLKKKLVMDKIWWSDNGFIERKGDILYFGGELHPIEKMLAMSYKSCVRRYALASVRHYKLLDHFGVEQFVRLKIKQVKNFRAYCRITDLQIPLDTDFNFEGIHPLVMYDYVVQAVVAMISYDKKDQDE